MKRIFLLTVMAGSITAQAQTLADAMKMTDNERFEKATSMFKSLLAREPMNGEIYFYAGENYFYADNADSAVAMYNKGIEVQPKLPLNYVGNGKVKWADGKETEARSMFTKAEEVCNEKGNRVKAEMKARMYLEMAEALVYNEKKDIDGALAYIAKAYELDPKNADVLILKGDALFEKDNTNASEPVSLFKQASQLDNTSPVPLSKKAYMFYRAGMFDRSVETFNEAIKLDPNYAPAYRLRAEAYYKTKQLEKGIEDYQKYLKLNNGNISARVRYAGFLYLGDKYEDALKEIAEIEKINPKIVLVKRIKGYCQFEMKDYDKSKSSLLKFLSLQPENKTLPTDYEYIAKVYLKKENLDSAVMYFVKTLKRDPTRRAGIAEAGTDFFKEKKYTESIRMFEIIAKLGAPEANDYYWLGSAAYYSQLCPKADTAFSKYIEMLPTVYQGYLKRGRARACIDAESKDWLAKSDYEKVAELINALDEAGKEKGKKDLEEAYYYIGFYYLSQKDPATAKCFYQKIIDLNTGSERNQNVVKSMESAEFKNVKAVEDCK